MTGRAEDLDLAVAAGRAALAVTPVGHPVRPQALDALAVALIRRHDDGDDPAAELDEPIALLRDALISEKPDLAGRRVNRRVRGMLDSRVRPGLLADLGRALLKRSAADADLTLLDEAITPFREALAQLDDRDANAPSMLAALGVAQRARFAITLNRSDLDGAVSSLRSAVARTALGSIDRSAHLSNLANALRTRCYMYESHTDLAEAIETMRTIVTGPAARAIFHARDLATYGSLLQEQARVSDDLAQLDQAIDCLRRAQDGAQGREEKLGFASMLAGALADRYHRTRERDDLSTAIATLRTVLDSRPEWAERLLAEGDLASCLAAWADDAPDQLERDRCRQEAIRLYRGVVAATEATLPGHYELAARRDNLAETLWDRHIDCNSTTDGHEALSTWRAIAADEQGPAPRRLRAASRCATAAASGSAGPGDAVPDYMVAVDVLTLAAWHGIDRRS